VNRSASRSLALRAPAKINLGLGLTGRRPDGYHLLESLFAPIALWDELELAVEPLAAGAAAAEIEVVCGKPLDPTLPPALHAVPSGPDNLVHRAARLFCERSGFAAKIRIGLRKAIPAGAGLGGGSSDAAAVLRGLAELSGLVVEPEVLAAWALELGADVPFFLVPGAARVTGIGERIERVTGLPELPILLANPGKNLATADVYRMADQLGGALTKNRAGSTMPALSGSTQDLRDAAPALRDLLINDLEPAARRLCPSIARIADRMAGQGALAVGMTGSGATVFGVFESEAAARAAAARWRAEDERGPSAAGREAEREAGQQTALEAGETDRCWVAATRVVASC
jgi:4-diphosphocytidyl-2-C-methyl-D-erythritol kinase